MPAMSAIVMQLQQELACRSAAVAQIASIDFVGRPPPFVCGAIYGLGYVLGELPNSFLKRRLGVAAGDRSPRFGSLQYVADQVDSVIGCLIALRTFHRPTRAEVISAAVLGSALHIGIDRSLYTLGVKRRVR
jgi:hypothetical protein